MRGLTLILADTGTEGVYILLVVGILVIGWVLERFKAAMKGPDARNPVPPRPTTRRHPTSLPRPIIPPLDDAETGQPRSRPPVPPVIPRPRPPIRPPAPPQRTSGGPPELRRPGPQRPRSVEERKAVIRGEAAPPRPARPTPQPVAPPPPPDQPENWARLGKFGEQISAPGPAQAAGGLKPQGLSAAQAMPGRAPAESFRELTSADLQRAFVLKEILEPPLALRD